MTLSPGSQTVIRATIMASVLPHVTTTCSSLLRSIPIHCCCFSTRACRKLAAPQVTAYWWGPCSMAFTAASITGWGGSASGNPCDRLMASYWFATRVISRITDSVKWQRRLAVAGIGSSLHGKGCFRGIILASNGWIYFFRHSPICL